MWFKSCLFALVLWLCSSSSHCQLPGCINPPGIVLAPNTNQTVPINTNTSVTYSCNVDSGREANWVFVGIQIPVNSTNRDTLAGRGVNITSGSSASEVFISINRAGREAFQNRELTIACYALDPNELQIMTSCNYYVRTYEPPGVLRNLDFNPLPTNLSRLVLTWDQPDNTLIDTGDPVVTTYTVTVSGPTFNFTDTTTDTRYEIVDSLDEECAEHNFQVHASNGAGVGPADFINETIPISPDIRNLSAQLTVSNIILTTPLNIEVTFPRAGACSSTFPLSSYLINVMGVVSTSFSASDSRIVGRELISLSMTNNLTQPDQVYSLSVSACISVTCRESPPVTFRTTDVQSANIVFFENNLYLTCSFASSSPARGCGFIFTATSNITEEFNVSQSESGLCTQLQNMENVYTSIVALDWESDGSYGNLLTVPTRNRTMTEEEYMAATGCTLPTTPTPLVEVVSEGLSGGALAGIVIAVILVALSATAIVIVIAIVAKGKMKKAAVGEVCVECDTGDVLDIKKSNQDLPDTGRVPAGAQGGPPPLSPPEVAKFKFQLGPGRKDGEVVINKTMLDKLQEMMKGGTEIKYQILASEPKD